MEDLVTSSIEILEKENLNTRRASEVVQKALSLIQKRQKLIKLADKSAAGWLVIDEYESE